MVVSMKKEVVGKKDVVKKEAAGVPALMKDMEKFSGMGHATSVEDYAIPFLTIIQSGSRQVKRGKPGYIEEAEVGMIHNTVTDEIFDGEEGILVVPVMFERKYLEWKPREEGGGLVKIYDREEGGKLEAGASRNDKNQMELENGNTLVATCQHYVLLIKSPTEMDRAIITMSSTQIKKSKKWNTIIARQIIPGTNKPAPSFAGKYLLTTIAESNNSGDWMGWVVEEKGILEEKEAHIFTTALNFYNAIRAGAVKVADMEQEVDKASEVM